jgi:hypothetical protein
MGLAMRLPGLSTYAFPEHDISAIQDNKIVEEVGHRIDYIPEGWECILILVTR